MSFGAMGPLLVNIGTLGARVTLIAAYSVLDV